MRTERAVHEEIARSADGSEFTDPRSALGVADRLGPVAVDAWAHLVLGKPEQPGEVVLAGDVGAGALVERADAEGGRVGACGALGRGALRGRHSGARGGAYGVVRVAGQRGVTVESGQFGDAGDQVEQGGGHHGRMDVDARQVERSAVRRLVEFPPGGRTALGPPRGVPAVPDEHPVPGVRGAVGAYEREGVGERSGAGQVESGEGEAGRGGVDVRVGERRGDEGAFEVYGLVDTRGEGVGGAFGAHPGDPAAFDDHRGGEGVGGAVDFSTAQQHGAGFALGGGAIVHAPQSPA